MTKLDKKKEKNEDFVFYGIFDSSLIRNFIRLMETITISFL